MRGVATHNGLFALISEEMQDVEARLRGPAEDDGALLSTVAQYALASGGSVFDRPCCSSRRGRAVPMQARATLRWLPPSR